MRPSATVPMPKEQEPRSSVPAAIRPEHKKKFALIYLRQSSFDQVKNNSGSTDSQRALAKLAAEWGWPPDLILVIEEDLGLSGTSSSQRTGLLRIEDMLDRGEVGLVIVRDASRLSRDPYDGERFLRKALRAGVLLEENGQLVDLARSRPTELFGLRLHNLLAWWDNEQRRHNFHTAKMAKIGQRKAISRPPIGYISASKGDWIKDPDDAVRDVIQQIKDTYQELWSTRKTAKVLHDKGVMFPRRIRGLIEWVQLRVTQVHGVLTNANYTADYHYGRRRVRKDADSGQIRSQRRPSSEWLVIRDHHVPYISREEWERIQAMLARGPRRQPAAGRGSGLLQGLLACGRCGGRWMRTVHDGRAQNREGSRVARYCCERVDGLGTYLHRMSCSAAGLDHVVFRAFRDAVNPVTIEAALTAAQESEAQQEAAELAKRRQLQHAESHVLELKRHFLSVDSSRTSLKVELEHDLDKALRDLDELRRTLSDRPLVAAITAADARELMELAAKIEDIWHATTTTNEDRKHLLATAISKVILRDSGEDIFDVEIVWASGRAERHQAFKSRGGTKLIVELRNAAQPVSQILKTVTAMGLTTQRGRPFTRKALQHKLWKLGFNKKGPRLEALGLVRSMLMERRSRQEILEALQTKGPKPYEGEWTQQRLTSAIRSIDSGAWAPAISPLPDGIPRLRRLAPEAIDVLINGRSAGRTFGEIVEELNTLGLRTPRGRPFNYLNAYQLYDHLQKDASLAERFGDKAPGKSSQGVGSQPAAPTGQPGPQERSRRTERGGELTQPLQLFTARYSNPNVAGSGLTPVGITRYPPRFRLAYELTGNLYDLAPTPAMLQIAKGENGRERFIGAYRAWLDTIGVHEIVRQLKAVQGDNTGLVLLCFEDVTTGEHWCHRLLLGEWLQEHAGLVVAELADPGKKAARKKATPDRQDRLR